MHEDYQSKEKRLKKVEMAYSSEELNEELNEVQNVTPSEKQNAAPNVI